MSALYYTTMFFMLSSSAGLPVGVPPAPEDPRMARMAPQECLFYATWSGTAKADSGQANQTEQLFAEPQLRTFVSRIEKLLITKLQTNFARKNSADAVLAEHLPGIAKHLLTHPTAMYISEFKQVGDNVEIKAGAIVGMGDAGDRIERSLLALLAEFSKEFNDVQIVIHGQTFHKIATKPEVAWGIHEGYLRVGVGPGAIEQMLASEQTGSPKWLQEVRKQLPIERLSTLTYVNLKAGIQQTRQNAVDTEALDWIYDALGFGNANYYAQVSGLDSAQFVNQTLFAVDGELTGMVADLVGKPLTADDLEPIPHDANFAMAGRFDAEKVMASIQALILNALEKGAATKSVEKTNDQKKANARKENPAEQWTRDIVKSLGPVWRIYNSPGEAGVLGTGITLVVDLRDRERLLAVQNQIMAKIAEATAKATQRRKSDLGPTTSSIELADFEFAGQKIHYFKRLSFSTSPVAPAWCVTDRYLVVALFPQSIKAFLGRRDDFRSLATQSEIKQLLASDNPPSAIIHRDTRAWMQLAYPIAQMIANVGFSELQQQGIDLKISAWPSANTILPHIRPGTFSVHRHPAGVVIVDRGTIPVTLSPTTVGLAMATMFPALSAVIEQAERTMGSATLKSIGLAAQVYQASHGHWPAAYSVDDNDKPLLSWRVHLLPYLDEKTLYNKFHLDEPWDSDHNKTLIPLMPKIYLYPLSDAEPGKTVFVTVRGDKTMFPGKTGVKMASITDRLSKTIVFLAVNDASAVTWTKPDDVAFDGKGLHERIFGTGKGMYPAAYVSGAVLTLDSSLDTQTLRGLLTRNGGEGLGDKKPGDK